MTVRNVAAVGIETNDEEGARSRRDDGETVSGLIECLSPQDFVRE